MQAQLCKIAGPIVYIQTMYIHTLEGAIKEFWGFKATLVLRSDFVGIKSSRALSRENWGVVDITVLEFSLPPIIVF